MCVKKCGASELYQSWCAFFAEELEGNLSLSEGHPQPGARGEAGAARPAARGGRSRGS